MKRYRCCILATCCVPWDEQYRFAEAPFRRQVRRLMDSGIRDLYVFGTAGEGYAVTDRQFETITRVFLEETAPDADVQPMVGVISLSLPTILERIERARDLGARRFQVSLPAWGALRGDELDRFFAEVCDRFPDCEFLHYNLMRAQRLVTPPEYARLARRHPNLVATKNSTTDRDRLRGLIEEAPELQHFITDVGFADAALMGECGLLISLAATNRTAALQFFQAGRERDAALLTALRGELEELLAALLEAVGDEAHMDGAYDKLFCRAWDPDFPIRLLPPYASASEAACARYLEALRTRFPRWSPV
jgi:dihydrodipicolinate synthase/N-acetylneuraminate lyase